MPMKTIAAAAGSVLVIGALHAADAQSLSGSRAAIAVPSWLIPREVDLLTAKAVLRNAQGEVIGSAVLAEAPYGVLIAIEVSRLSPGRHGFHVHEVGRCDPPGFGSAGGHFNPRHKRHGLLAPDGPHVGDLPNLVVGPDGTARTELYLAHATLGAGTTSLFHPDGTALVVHANPDNEATDPDGNAGAWIACGAIGLQ